VDCKIEGGSTRAERLPVPRVASEANVVQSHQHYPSSRHPAATEGKNRSSPFAALLDDPLPARSPGLGAAPQAGAASESNSRPHDRTRRNDNDEGQAPTDRQRPDAPVSARLTIILLSCSPDATALRCAS
jgi:hypothetical protein